MCVNGLAKKKKPLRCHSSHLITIALDLVKDITIQNYFKLEYFVVVVQEKKENGEMILDFRYV